MKNQVEVIDVSRWLKTLTSRTGLDANELTGCNRDGGVNGDGSISILARDRLAYFKVVL